MPEPTTIGTLRRSQDIPAIRIELTEEQKRAIADYVQETGRLPEISLAVDVIEGKIAPSAVAVGAV